MRLPVAPEGLGALPAALPVAVAPREREAAWLFGRRLDLAVLLAPLALTLGAVAAAAAAGDASGSSVRAYGNWAAQFVLGNTTHVILTFLLLGARTDVLHAAPGQARTVVLGSAATFAVFLAAFGLTAAFAPAYRDFVGAIALVFSFHHTASQGRGIWSLYNLRGRAAGTAPPSARERTLQQAFAPLSLLLISVRFLFVEKAAGLEIPFFSAFVGIPAILPHAASWPMLAVWGVYAGVLAAELGRATPRNGPKLLYVTAHVSAVGAMIVWPGWGGLYWSGLHGLEYFALSARMLAPRDGAERTRLSRVHVAMALSMLPLLAVGLVNAPFAARVGLGGAAAFKWPLYAANAVVMAHYFADAWIYRFRIASVREVALRRLGFA